MKIKEVCKQTGLTDRAVRFYIDNELIQPSYSENYTGRKAYDFSEKDVEILKQIATLREYDFSIDEIRYLLMPEGDVQLVLEEHIKELKEKSQKDINNIENLIKSLGSSPWTPEELCNSLNESELKPNIISDNNADEKQLAKQKKQDLIVVVISTAVMLIGFLIAFVITQKGLMNETTINYFFAVESFFGFLLINFSFDNVKYKRRFVIYLFVILIIYLLGLFYKYIV